MSTDVNPVSHQQFYLIMLQMKYNGMSALASAEKIIEDPATLNSFRVAYRKWDILMKAVK
jgi:hypothetical protein